MGGVVGSSAVNAKVAKQHFNELGCGLPTVSLKRHCELVATLRAW